MKHETLYWGSAVLGLIAILLAVPHTDGLSVPGQPVAEATQALAATAALRPIERVPVPAIDGPVVQSVASRPAPVVGKPSFWEAYRKSNVDLIRLFMEFPERVRLADLVRNPALNPADAELSDRNLDELGALVEYSVLSMAKVREDIREAKCKEMVALIEAGKVTPLLPQPGKTPLPPALVRQLVAKAMRADPSRTEAEWTAIIKQQYANEPAWDIDYIQHKGQYYAIADFRSLPQTERSMGQQYACGFEFLTRVMFWFETRGFARTVDVEAQLSAAQRWAETIYHAYNGHHSKR